MLDMNSVFKDTRHLPELLAPAGNPAMLHAAVRAGADAVYLGMQSFNARRNAGNFDDAALAEAVRYCHLRGVRVYVTMNTLILQSEMDEAVSCAKTASALGVDAFIVQDLGLLCRLREACPQVRLHASTQMSIHSSAGIQACAQLGVRRVTLARELSLPEIASLCDEASALGMQVEVFAHGAICVCYSGQCLMSSLIGARSANRGFCAQPCRLAYRLIDPDDPERVLRSPGDHLLSPRDLCTVSDLGALIDAGVDSLKIEGRMKSPEYVFTTVSVYREALDRAGALRAESGAPLAAESPDDSLSASSEGHAASGSGNACASSNDGKARYASFDQRDFESAAAKKLQSVFSRGFTSGYLHSDRSNALMAYQRPNNRGESVGRVKSAKDGMLHFSCNSELAEGDVLEVWTTRGNVVVSVGGDFSQTSRGAHVPLPDDDFEQRFSRRDSKGGRGSKKSGACSIQEGDRVFRVRSADAAYADDEREPRIPVLGKATLRIGKPLCMTFSAACEHSGQRSEASSYAEGPIVESARTRAVSSDEVLEHIDRLGQTPFALSSLEIDLDDNVGIGFSQLHRCRTEALANLEEAILSAYDSEGGDAR